MPKDSVDTEVPLAVLSWTDKGLDLLRMWPVRRRLTRPNAVTDSWGYFASDRRLSEGEAYFQDFQEEIAALLKEAPRKTGADELGFKLLPPAGVLPEAVWKTFLGPLGPAEPTPMDASLWPARLRESFAMEPIALTDFTKLTKYRSSGPILPALKVYEIPERKNEVFFARSLLGRVRVFLEDRLSRQPTILVMRSADGSARFALHGLNPKYLSDTQKDLLGLTTYQVERRSCIC